MYSLYNNYYICYADSDELKKAKNNASKEVFYLKYYNKSFKFKWPKFVIYKNILKDDIIAEHLKNTVNFNYNEFYFTFGVGLIKSEKIVEERFLKYLKESHIIHFDYVVINNIISYLDNMIEDLLKNLMDCIAERNEYESEFIFDICDKKIIKFINFILNIDYNSINKFEYSNKIIKNKFLSNIKELLDRRYSMKKLVDILKKFEIFPVSLGYLHSLFDFEFIDPEFYKFYIAHIKYDPKKETKHLSDKFIEKIINEV